MVPAIIDILSVLEATGGVLSAVEIGTRVLDFLRESGRRWRAEKIRQFLERLGNTSEPQVRRLVEDWAKSRPDPPTAAETEALIGVLINLTRKARFVTTQGSVRSSILRSLPLIDQLISDIQPVRRRGEAVAPHQDWKLERYLGMGTFGEVWMARNPGFPRPRAYKFFTRPGSLEWVRREQQSLYAVKDQLGDHPNLIRFEDVAIGDQPMPFIALEYAGGGSLEDWVLEDPEDRPALNKHDVILGLANGLMTAHDHGISHRDLKPANVVLTDGPRPVAKITDFGLGRVAAGLGSLASSTQAIAVGTPMYLPPEALAHRPNRSPAQDDVFALGIVWYQLLTERLERPPYDFAGELRSHGLDSRTITLVSRCLARPENRYKDAGELVAELEFVGLPDWDVPPGLLDVQGIFREYHAVRPDQG